MILAHYDKESNKKQGLVEHSFNVAQDARNKAISIGQGDVLFLIALYHDLGKADRLFQEKLESKPNQHVDHSYAGAKYLTVMIKKVLSKIVGSQEKEQNLFNEIVGYVISAHHGVYDIYFDDGSRETLKNSYNKFYKRRQGPLDETYHFKEDVVPFARELEKNLADYGYESFETLIRKAWSNFQEAWRKLSSKDESETAFYSGCMVRLYLSLLKNADIVDTINAYYPLLVVESHGSREKLIQSYYQSVEELYESFGKPTTELNRIRTEIAERVKLRGREDLTGIYRMNLPTGAGKTNLSLRYAIHQMLYQKKCRFFYITPFLSVLEQNAATIKKVVGEKGVLEHHSNVVQKSYEEKDGKQDTEDTKMDLQMEYLAGSWDSPIVLTSMVQFFQTLFKTKSANIRRFSSLIDSVVILDEVQSLPIEVTSLFNLSMNFVSKVMNATIVLSTATQPVYDSQYVSHQLMYGGGQDQDIDIVRASKEEEAIFTRTELYKFDDKDGKASLKELSEYILENECSILAIVNTKSTVDKLYRLLEEQTDRPLYQLSTNMCPQHRLDFIEEIKDGLKNDLPLICVSTQLIEAGVDVDFDQVIRSYAGIDSIVQAAGRCNREGRRDIGRVTLVNLTSEEENLSRLQEIKNKKDATESILYQTTSPIDVAKLNREFFETYYANHYAKMDYPLGDNETAYDYLSQNKMADSRFLGCLRQSFKTAGREMNLINDESMGVFVPYGRAKEELERLEEELTKNSFPTIQELVDIKKRIKQLQAYTVNMREGDERLDATRSYLNGQILILQEEYYDEKVGIKKEADSFIL